MSAKCKVKKMDEGTVRKVYGWCVYFARKHCQFSTPTYDVGDLAAIAFLAALEHYPRWDARKGMLSTFLSPRIKGAIKDHIREYMRGRARGKVYKDHETTRFSVLENYLLTQNIECDLEDIIARPTKSLDYTMEVKEELDVWKKQNHITRKEWLVLIYYYGHNLPMDVIGAIIGISESRVSQINASLQERLHLPDVNRADTQTRWRHPVPYKSRSTVRKKKK